MSRTHLGPVFRVQCGRRPFITRMGYFGIGPADTEPGHTVCLLNGGQPPYVVRRVDTRCRLLGEWYIHGIMGGETLPLLWPEDQRKPEGRFVFGPSSFRFYIAPVLDNTSLICIGNGIGGRNM